ncbi:MAG: SMP-30/gluconolactonase/LRE family protein [Actinomycetota bacterium]
MNARAERLTAPLAHHGEGPFWDHVTRRLLCMDVLAGVIVAIEPSGEVSRYKVPSPAATVVRRRASGGFVVASETGVFACNDDFSAFGEIATLPLAPGIRTNDGGCDPHGAFIIGTMAYDERVDAGAVYRIGCDHQVTELLSPVTISNGVQWSSDCLRAFYVDTPTRHVAVFDVDPATGSWAGRRAHISLAESLGYPDGMAIDEEDGLWVALWGAGAVHHFDATGRFVEAIDVPGVTQVSSCTFGGSGNDILFITTSRQGLSEAEEASAGAVFAYQASVRGQAVRDYGG